MRKTSATGFLERAVAGIALVLVAAGALADEAAVRLLVETRLRHGATIDAVRKLPFADLYEVAIRSPDGPLVYYVDGGASVIIAGEIIDAKSGRNLTGERLRTLSAIKWDRLPFGSAVTTVRGNGRRKIYPVIKPASVPLATSVWCSRDRAKAWDDLMLRGIAPPASPDCDTPVDKLVALGHRLGATSTPTWFLQNGERFSGAMRLEDVRALLDKASPVQ